MHLKEHLSRTVKGSKPVAEFLQTIKTIADELAVINSPVDDIDLVIHTLNGLDSDFKEVATALHTRETPVSFDELHDILTDFEAYLQRNDHISESPTVITANHVHKGKSSSSKARYSSSSSGLASSGRATSPTNSKRVTCQYCDKSGHTAKVCYKLHGYPPRSGSGSRPSAHHAQVAPPTANNDWILDSGASHHITHDLDQLHLTSPYNG